jgi:hypothetical protein
MVGVMVRVALGDYAFALALLVQHWLLSRPILFVMRLLCHCIGFVNATKTRVSRELLSKVKHAFALAL